MIKTIIFDNNGVLTTSGEEDGFKAVERIIGPKIDQFIILNYSLVEAGDSGKIRTEDFFQRIIDRLELKSVSPRDMEKTLYGSLRSKNDVLKIAKRLGLKYEIALLTDFGDSFWKWNKKWRLDKVFDKNKMFISSDIGLVKPHKDIFLYVLKKLSKKPEEVLFIDDKKENVDAARKLGMRAVRFYSALRLKRDLNKEEVLI